MSDTYLVRHSRCIEMTCPAIMNKCCTLKAFFKSIGYGILSPVIKKPYLALLILVDFFIFGTD